MTRHIHAEVLAGYRSGDLSPRTSRRIKAHLDGCRRCLAASDDLAAVSSLLSSVGAPPMPAGVTARIEAALAAEAAARPARSAATDGLLAPAGRPGGGATPRRSAGRSGSAGHSSRTGTRRRAGWPGLHSPLALRALAGAAVVAVVAGGAYTAGQLVRGNDSVSSSGSSAGNAPAGAAAGSGASRSASQSQLAPRAARPGPSAEAAPGPALQYRASGRSVTFVPVTTATNFGAPQLGSMVQGLLQESTASRPMISGSGQAAGTAGSFSGIPVAMLEGCVTRVAAGGRVRLVDVARYQGRKATIVVVAPAGGGSQQIWVVGPACSASRSDVIARSMLPGSG